MSPRTSVAVELLRLDPARHQRDHLGRRDRQPVLARSPAPIRRRLQRIDVARVFVGRRRAGTACAGTAAARGGARATDTPPTGPAGTGSRSSGNARCGRRRARSSARRARRRAPPCPSVLASRSGISSGSLTSTPTRGPVGEGEAHLALHRPEACRSTSAPPLPPYLTRPRRRARGCDCDNWQMYPRDAHVCMATVLVGGAVANKLHNGGEAWVRLSWIRGLQRLGLDVWFVEQIDAAHVRRRRRRAGCRSASPRTAATSRP